MNQREIKFRVWNKDKKQWERHALGMGTDGQLITNHNEDFELQQFTGLTDKNGKEIYEGDILQRSDGKYGGTWKVIYSKGGFGAKEERPDFGTNKLSNYYGLDSGIFHDDIWEIIGNIHETPTLLAV
jgi:uncharacterized phage protein (TIGR01671 family)